MMVTCSTLPCAPQNWRKEVLNLTDRNNLGD